MKKEYSGTLISNEDTESVYFSIDGPLGFIDEYDILKPFTNKKIRITIEEIE